jgi:hypothetical protein
VDSSPEQNQAGRHWLTKAIAFSVTATLAAVLAGAMLGALGGLVPVDVRIALASLLGLLAVVVGTLDVVYRRIPLFERSCETPRHWLMGGALTWAVRNGSALGVGATSRIGFWLWYVIPVSALLIGRADVGALIYGTYGLVRGVAVWPVLLGGLLRIESMMDSGPWLIRRFRFARKVTSVQLAVVGVLVVWFVGL